MNATMKAPFNPQETATILAALKTWQAIWNVDITIPGKDLYKRFVEIARGYFYADGTEALVGSEIDALCDEVMLRRSPADAIAEVLAGLEDLRDKTSEDPDADSIYLNGFFTLSTYNAARQLVGLAPLLPPLRPVNTGKTMEAAVELLRAWGVLAAYEHPGYIAIPLAGNPIASDSESAKIGCVNGNYEVQWGGLNWPQGAQERSLAGRGTPAAVLAGAIKAWFKEVL